MSDDYDTPHYRRLTRERGWDPHAPADPWMFGTAKDHRAAAAAPDRTTEVSRDEVVRLMHDAASPVASDRRTLARMMLIGIKAEQEKTKHG